LIDRIHTVAQEKLLIDNVRDNALDLRPAGSLQRHQNCIAHEVGRHDARNDGVERMTQYY
jgi:hypothetical protein